MKVYAYGLDAAVHADSTQLIQYDWINTVIWFLRRKMRPKAINIPAIYQITFCFTYACDLMIYGTHHFLLFGFAISVLPMTKELQKRKIKQ